MLSGTQQEINNKIAIAIPSLGNCATPVNQFIVQSYIGLKIKNGKEIEPEIAERCAVREEISTKLNTEILTGCGRDFN